ncbi:MAG: nucleotidyltransferase domain-containing protein [Lachnospiraceae bacterium]|nr:nucleotidyltransferase domain-containing protein [Lachnospiraceae bacterium]
MKREILEKLNEIERKEHVKILYAVESGSRAWGVASHDSDYDVRFVYVRKAEDYLRLDGMRDVIEWQLDEVLDMNGWDLKKALQHFHKGNAALFEWCDSPIVYRATPEWKAVCEVGKKYFSEKAAMYHYYGTARSTYEGFLTGELVKYKKYVYALRPILACRYIEENHSAPPVLFEELKEKQLPEHLIGPVERMLEAKASGGEKDLLPQVPEIIDFIRSELDRISKIAKEKTDEREKDWAALNAVFFRTVAGSDLLCYNGIQEQKSECKETTT